MSGHVPDLLPLAAAGTLDPAEAARGGDAPPRVRGLRQGGRGVARRRRRAGRLPAPKPSRALVARTVETVEQRLAERAEQAWNRAALGFLVAFAWTLAVLSWVVVDLVNGVLALRLERSVESSAAWYAAYLVAGWLSAGAAAVLLGRRAREEGRIA